MLTRVILELYSKQSGLLSPSSLEKGEKQTKVHWRIPCFVLSQLPIEKNSSSLTGMCPETYWQATTTREDLTALTISQKAKSFLRPILEAAPVEVPIAFLSHLSSPDSDTLFKKLKDLGSAKFNPATENICSLENLLRKMTERAGGEPSTWQTIHWERQQSLFCLKKTLRHVTWRLSQGTKAIQILEATVSDRRSTSLSQCQHVSLLSSTEKGVNQLLVQS